MKLIICVIYIFFISPLYGQGNKNFEFIGALQMQEGVVISYKINFKELQGGEIEGTSFTDIYGDNATRSKIVGKYSAKGNSISFHETENISTKSISDVNEFCFVIVENAKIKTLKGKKIIQGTFTGKFNNKQNCSEGNIYLVSSDQIEMGYDKLVNSQMVKSNDSLKLVAEKYNALIKTSKETKLHANENLKLMWSSEEIIFDVWDGLNIDNDKISIIINEKIILENFVIGREKKRLVFPFHEDSCIIKIIAVNEGEIAPNTVNIILIDKETTTPVLTSLEKGEFTLIKIEKNK